MKRLSGFSLMEMMVVLLIVAIVAAATAPMVSKKLTSGTGSASLGGMCLWSSDSAKNKIWFNGDGLPGRQVSIGEKEVEDKNTGGIHTTATMLNINTKDNNRPQISLRKDSDTQLMGLFNGSSFWLSTSKPHNLNDQKTVAIGREAMTSGNYVTALGYDAQAHGSIDGNSYTTAIGAHTKTLGIYSTAIGFASHGGENGSDSFGNTAVGALAVADKNSSIALGSGAIAKANHSIAIGTIVPKNSNIPTAEEKKIEAKGEKSIAIGAGAKAWNSNAISIGSVTGYLGNYANSTTLRHYDTISKGEDSIAIGSGAYSAGTRSIALGTTYNASTTAAQQTSAVAEDSIVIGSGAYNTTSAKSSIAIGENAYTYGSSSVAIGPWAKTVGNGDGCMAIGLRAKSHVKNAIAIGTDAEAKTSDTIVLGTAGTTVYIPGNLVVAKMAALNTSGTSRIWMNANNEGDDTGYIYMRRGENMRLDGTSFATAAYGGGFSSTLTSDRRLKNVGEEFKGGLEQIKKLEVFNFTYKKDPDKTPRVGVMAQDLQKIFPKAVIKGEDGFLRIRMEDMFYALVNAVKELASKFESHDKQIEELIKQNQEQQKLIEKLEKRLEKLEKKV